MTSRPVDPATTGRSAGTHRTRTVVLIAVAAAVIAGLVGLGLGGLGGVLLSSGSAGGSGTDQDTPMAARSWSGPRTSCPSRRTR